MLSRLIRFLTVIGMCGTVCTCVLLLSGAQTNTGAAPPTSNSPPAKSDAAVSKPEHTYALGVVDAPNGLSLLTPGSPYEVIEIPVKENDEVAKNAVLLRMDNRFAKAKLNQAKAGLSEAVSELAMAERSLQNYDKLLAEAQAAVAVEKKKLGVPLAVLAKAEKNKGNFASQEEVNQAQAAVEAQQAAVELAHRRLETLEASKPKELIDKARANVALRKGLLEEAELNLDLCELRAPCDGKVLRVLAKLGMAFGPQAKSPAVWFQPAGELIVRVELEQEWVSRVTVGDEAEIVDDVKTAMHTWKGKVTSISPTFLPKRQATPIPDPFTFNEARVVEAIVSIEPDAKNPVRFGQKVRVKLAATKR